MSKETLFVSFSGGRTSAYMCWWLLNNKADVYDFIFIFANTGLEHENTLKFVNQCDKGWGLNLVWVEAVISPIQNVGTAHKVVTFETATRGDALFEDLCEAFGIPNKAYPHCNRDLKIQPIKHYKASLGFKRNHLTAIGLRGDEIDRMDDKKEEHGLVYPLISWSITYKPEVFHWWASRPFDLEVEEHYGNCVSCWKKSDRKILTIFQDDPSLSDSFARLEKKYGHVKAPEKDRVFFRKNRNTEEMLELSNQEFERFVEYVPELQLRLISDGCFDIDELDIEDSCGSSCEAF